MKASSIHVDRTITAIIFCSEPTSGSINDLNTFPIAISVLFSVLAHHSNFCFCSFFLSSTLNGGGTSRFSWQKSNDRGVREPFIYVPHNGFGKGDWSRRFWSIAFLFCSFYIVQRLVNVFWVSWLIDIGKRLMSSNICGIDHDTNELGFII